MKLSFLKNAGFLGLKGRFALCDKRFAILLSTFAASETAIW